MLKSFYKNYINQKKFTIQKFFPLEKNIYIKVTASKLLFYPQFPQILLLLNRLFIRKYI